MTAATLRVSDTALSAYRLAVYGLTVVDGNLTNDSLVSGEKLNFADYSEFKYGQLDHSRRYAEQIAARLEEHFTATVGDDEGIIVIGTPYKSLPNAAKVLSSIAEQRLRDSGLQTTYSRI